MAVYCVTYDLRKPDKDYASLLAAIRKYTHCHALKSAFFIDTPEDRKVVRDKLKKLVDANDQLYVLRLNGEWAATRAEPCCDWLNDSNRNW